jgi:hypothetical protein
MVFDIGGFVKKHLELSVNFNNKLHDFFNGILPFYTFRFLKNDRGCCRTPIIADFAFIKLLKCVN